MVKVLAFGACITMLLLLQGCEPIWIQDPIDPRLPKYTEAGNNVAGALVNGKLWRAERECFYDFWGAECVNNIEFESNADESLTVSLDGELEEHRSVSFHFNLAGRAFTNPTDILSLHTKKFEIDGIVNKVTMNDSLNPCIENSIGEGQIYFRNVAKAQNSSTIICSGTFGFAVSGLPGCGNYEVFYGRFDFTK